MTTEVLKNEAMSGNSPVQVDADGRLPKREVTTEAEVQCDSAVILGEDPLQLQTSLSQALDEDRADRL